MSNGGFNPAEFKNVLRQDWDRAAGGWDKWWEVIEKGSRPVSQRLLELAVIKEGDRILDVATGIGEPAISAAKMVGPRGRVVAVDFSQGMLEVARRRASQLGLGNMEFHVMDGEELKLDEDGFDAVLCRWGLMFFPDPASALTTMTGLLKKGGRLAAAVWDTPDKVPMISLPMGVVRKELKLPPPPSDKPNPFSLADKARCERMLREAGLNVVSVEGIDVTLELPDIKTYCAYIKDVAGPVMALLKDQSEERRTQIWKAIEGACGRFALTSGGIKMENQAICVAGRK
ncbi:MAG: methyltransferase domain-containing protein [Deltaproteobacteria bacterium]|nr:methyltransferase domain-containing protein [Deltaproteobacteria bacterium]